MWSGKGAILSVCHCNVDEGDTGKEETSLYIYLHVIGTRLWGGVSFSDICQLTAQI